MIYEAKLDENVINGWIGDRPVDFLCPGDFGHIAPRYADNICR
jgi:hypothetical protein